MKKMLFFSANEFKNKIYTRSCIKFLSEKKEFVLQGIFAYFQFFYFIEIR